MWRLCMTVARYENNLIAAVFAIFVIFVGFLAAIYNQVGLWILIFGYIGFWVAIFLIEISRGLKIFSLAIVILINIFIWNSATFEVPKETFYADGWQAIIKLYDNRLTYHDLSVIYMAAKKADVEPYRAVKTIVYSDAPIPDYNSMRLARVRLVKNYFCFHPITGMRLSVFITSQKYDRWENENYSMLVVSSNW